MGIFEKLKKRRMIKKGFAGNHQWITKVIYEGKEYGGKEELFSDARIELFAERFEKVKTVLELGSLEGAHSISMVRRTGVEKVLGIEGRDYNIKKAEFLCQLLDVENVQFQCENLENFDLFTLGTFDAVFCVGLLYHLPNPWDLLERISSVSDKLFMWTQYGADDKLNAEHKHYKGWRYKEFGFDEPLSGLSPESFWFSYDSLMTCLKDCGFSKIDVIKDERDNQVLDANENPVNLPCITLAAVKE